MIGLRIVSRHLRAALNATVLRTVDDRDAIRLSALTCCAKRGRPSDCLRLTRGMRLVDGTRIVAVVRLKPDSTTRVGLSRHLRAALNAAVLRTVDGRECAHSV